MTAPVSGVCRFCNCTEADPCRLAHGDVCGWVDFARTACTKPSCWTAWFALPKFRRPRKRTPADINALIRKKGRKPRAGSKAGAA